MAKTNYQSIDQYHEAFSGESLLRMQSVRKIIKKVAPDAEESISYQIPTFKFRGVLIHYSGYKNHISIYYLWSVDLLSYFKSELKIYKVSKSAIQFSNDKPLPEKLIKKIIVFRKKENESQHKKN